MEFLQPIQAHKKLTNLNIRWQDPQGIYGICGEENQETSLKIQLVSLAS